MIVGVRGGVPALGWGLEYVFPENVAMDALRSVFPSRTRRYRKERGEGQ